MKNTRCILVFTVLNVLINYCAFSQDTIVFKDKQRQVVLVKEVSPTEIQYKKNRNARWSNVYYQQE